MTTLTRWERGYIDENGLYHMPPGVTAIAARAFWSCTALREIELPPGLTTIANSAFNGCSSLTSLTLPDSVTEIGEWVFSSCSRLTSLTLPDSLSKIGEWAFTDCTALRKIKLPAGLTTISSCAFHRCSSLTSVSIPHSVTEVGELAFLCCTSLAHLTITGSLAGISGSAFRGCTSLNYFNIDKRRIDEVDESDQTLLQRVISSLGTPDNVIQALVLAGANISNMLIPPARAALGAQMVAWKGEYQLKQYRAQIQPVINDIVACKAGFGPDSPITKMPMELLAGTFFSVEYLQDKYQYITQADLNQLRAEVCDAAALDSRRAVDPKVKAKWSLLESITDSVITTNCQPKGVRLLLQYARKQELEAWKAKGGSTAMLPYTPKP